MNTGELLYGKKKSQFFRKEILYSCNGSPGLLSNNSSGKLWEGWNLSAIFCIVLFFPIKTHPQLYFTSVLTIPASVSLFYNCSPMLLISFSHTLHAMHTPDKIWDSKRSEFSSFSSIPSQQQIKTYATLLSWHNFFHLCWGNALEHIQHWQ